MDLMRIIYNLTLGFNTKFITMANVRRLKKDIDLIMSTVLTDCFYVMEYNSKVDKEELKSLAEDVVRQHRDFRIRANHPDGKDNPKLVKKYYRKLVDDLVDTANRDFEKLSEEVKKTT